MLPNPVIVPLAMSFALPGGVVPDMPLPPPHATRAAAAARRTVGIILFMTLTSLECVLLARAFAPGSRFGGGPQSSGLGFAEPWQVWPYMRHDVSQKEIR